MKIYIIIYPFLLLITCSLCKTDCKTRLQQCEAKKPYPRRQVCGTDNQTYPNRCALIRVQCNNNTLITVKHQGRCKDKQPCWVDQGRKISSKDGLRQQDYVPECLADGTYAPIQCHKSLGYCWCVTQSGKVIQGTSIHHVKPNCPHRNRWDKDSSEVADNDKENRCHQANKILFINNLLRIFKTEYNRNLLNQQNSLLQKQSALTNIERNAIEWKFSSMDKDSNDVLTKNEYRELRKLVKKVVKPKICSKSFIRICDKDQNFIISRQEWLSCLSNANQWNTSRQKGTENTFTSIEQPDSESEEDESDESGAVVSVLTGGIPLLHDHPLKHQDENPKKEEVNDCASDRKNTLEEHRSGSQEIFIPECTPEGRYKQIQCYKSTGYCWCVLEDSGKPIAGTSVKDSNPKCDAIHLPPRPIKGCPEHRKLLFIKDLLELLKKTLNTTGEVTIDTKTQISYENIASLGFNNLDVNRNKVLEKKEWKKIRSMVSTNKLLRRCGRRLPRYCDANQDHKITITEWINCLNTQNIMAGTTPNSTSFRRRGPNPLESYLKEDD